MNAKLVKSLLLLALSCSAIFALTIISADLYAAHAMTDKCKDTTHHEEIVALVYTNDLSEYEYRPCGGDPVPGGGVP
jgi:hypothetical protein